MTSDYTLFKFRAINKNLLDSLAKSYLYFAHPDQLNDPFDCRVDVDKALVNAIARSTATKAQLEQLQGNFDLDQIKDMAGNAGVCSFSDGDKPLENSLMWSHYADCHKGICFTYSIPEHYLVAQSDQLPVVSEVNYGINPITDWLIQPELIEGLSFNETFLVKLLTAKSACWSYEKEVRIISREQGQMEIDRSFLKQICFGLNTPKTDIDLIKMVSAKFGYSASFCQVQRSVDDFGLKIVELP